MGQVGSAVVNWIGVTSDVRKNRREEEDMWRQVGGDARACWITCARCALHREGRGGVRNGEIDPNWMTSMGWERNTADLVRGGARRGLIDRRRAARERTRDSAGRQARSTGLMAQSAEPDRRPPCANRAGQKKDLRRIDLQHVYTRTPSTDPDDDQMTMTHQ